MIAVKVSYTVNEDYIASNKEMIKAFLKAFEALDGQQFQYAVFQKENSGSFVHLSQYQNKEIQEQLLNIPEFLKFQEQRDKNLASEPEIEWLNAVGKAGSLV